MAFQDKTLTCAGCQAEWCFTAAEQEWYASKAFVDPRRCPACRKRRKEDSERRAERNKIVTSILKARTDKGGAP